MSTQIFDWFVFRAGDGPPLLFLHNGGGSLWNWAHQLEYFAPNYEVIAPDLPGFGRSYRPQNPLTLTGYVDGLSLLLDQLDLPAPPILIGNCIGASIALALALREPRRVQALGLFNLCGGAPMLHPRLRFWATWRPSQPLGQRVQRAFLTVASHPRLQRFNAAFLYANRTPTFHPQLQRFVNQQHRDPRLRPALDWLTLGLESFEIFSQPQLKPHSFPPVLLAWGAQNRTLSPEWATHVAKWLAPDDFWLIEQTGHMPMYEQPALVNQRLAGFFALASRGIMPNNEIR